MTNFTKPLVLAGAIAGLAMLPACSDSSDTEGGETSESLVETSGTVADALGDISELGTLRSAVEASELGSLFDGPGAYTILAPNDAAFAALGEQGAALMEDDQRALLVGLLRDHILPGQLTPDDIEKAIIANGGEVSMTSFGGSTVSFSQDGETLTVTREDGASTSFAGTATAANNGAILPIDAVLVPAE